MHYPRLLAISFNIELQVSIIVESVWARIVFDCLAKLFKLQNHFHLHLSDEFLRKSIVIAKNE